MYTKAQIFNLALQQLLLNRQISNADNDSSNEAKALRTVFPATFAMVLADLDLNSIATQTNLTLIEANPNNLWAFSYLYPADCIKLRRIQTLLRKDDDFTYADKAIRVKAGVKCIFTDAENAVIEYISSNTDITMLSASAGMCLAVRLAQQCAPLIAGKGASELIKLLDERYKSYKAEALQDDENENFTIDNPLTSSSWVRERTT